MRTMLVAVMLLGCQGAVATVSEPARPMPPVAPSPVAPASVAPASAGPTPVAPPRAAPSAATDADDGPVGAVPIPDHGASPETPIHEIDHEVTFEELPRSSARWQTTKRLRHAGRVLIALHVVSHTSLGLSVVDTQLKPESTYPGVLETFDLGPTSSQDAPAHGNAYPARDGNDDPEGGIREPIRFAIRPRVRDDGSDAERRQVAVYVVGRAVLVAERFLGTRTWTPRLRIDLPRATEIVAIDPGWH